LVRPHGSPFGASVGVDLKRVLAVGEKAPEGQKPRGVSAPKPGNTGFESTDPQREQRFEVEGCCSNSRPRLIVRTSTQRHGSNGSEKSAAR
jgi:hypothetical protein